MEEGAENQIVLRRIKHDFRYCTTPCWGIVFGPIYLASVEATGMSFTIGYAGIIAVFMLITILTFCFRPKTAEFSMVFEAGSPTHVRVTADIKNLVSSIPEWYSLKVRLRNPTTDQGPEIHV